MGKVRRITADPIHDREGRTLDYSLQHVERTQVAIIGAGPAGLLLAHLLYLRGIDSVVLETRSRSRVESRIRAGQLESATVGILTRAGVGSRLNSEGLPQPGVLFRYNGETRRLDLQKLTGRGVMIYGQREVVKDLINARLAAGGIIVFDVSEVAVHDLATDGPFVIFKHAARVHRLRCDFIAGCDGFHGVCRPAIAHALSTFECRHPVGWLGILAEAPPISKELLYSCHDRGFALFSMRTPRLSRLYLQCAPDEDPQKWSDEQIWSELRLRLDTCAGDLQDGPILERSVVSMRSFVAEPMQSGRLFLAGDAAHIVPPSAAKGLNLAVGDVCLLADALERFYAANDERPLREYSSNALARIWEGQRFSQWMTDVLHPLASDTPFERRVRISEIDRIFNSDASAVSFAEAYVGRPLDG
jgi:p-hydroxybenzoate 3-monooxygenase